MGAINRGFGPAYLVARWIGCGITGAWIAWRCRSPEFHHAHRYAGGKDGGRPTDYYPKGVVLLRWFLANQHAAERGDGSAARRLRRIEALMRAWKLAPVATPRMLAEIRQGELALSIPSEESGALIGCTGVFVTETTMCVGRVVSDRPRYLTVWDRKTWITERVPQEKITGRDFWVRSCPPSREELMARVKAWGGELRSVG